MIFFCTQGVAFAYASEMLIKRARSTAFRVLLRQDIAFFDKETTGALTSFLSSNLAHLASISGYTLGTLVNCATTLLACMAVALAIGWKLGLVCIATLPVILGAGFLRYWIVARFAVSAQQMNKVSASYACEYVNAIRTVASLTNESRVIQIYEQRLAEQVRRLLHVSIKHSALHAFSSSATMLAMALGFWYGGNLVSRGEYTVFQFFIVFAEILFGAQSAGLALSYMGDIGKARHAAAELRALVDRKPSIETDSDMRKGPDDEIEGQVEFRNVHYCYSTRPTIAVLRGLDLVARPGEFVALVGASGCGKSTAIALLERFYDPIAGGIFVDGQDISLMNVRHYRSKIGVVSQQPSLFQGTIRENIQLGSSDNVSEERIIQSCKDANIWDFISSLPSGLDTPVGANAGLLSGGQKQRIAIARALIRNPRILLLDEATSALDSQSEQIVQSALEKASRGRTTIAVAHRLRSIQGADVIYLLDQGRVVEQGTHPELMALGGKYRALADLQRLDNLP
jgi:ATP-binding cassette, subfamily B (MDR/TAP), member 1